jgi:DNA-binding HxlR family transcriptional regulator
MTSEPLNGPTEPAAAQQWRRADPLVRLLAGRWTLAVLAELLEGGRRYQDLHDALDGLSYKVLTETLRRAERDGLIARHLDGERIEIATLYELTVSLVL